MAFINGDIGPKVFDGERDRFAIEAVGRVSHQLKDTVQLSLLRLIHTSADSAVDCVNTEIGFFPYLPRQHNRTLQNPQIPASSVNEPLYHLIEAFQAEFKVSDSKQRENLINIFELSK